MNTNEKIENSHSACIQTPKTPRCLAIVNDRNSQGQSSTVLTLKKHEMCQTQLSYLNDIDEIIDCDELYNPIVIKTNNPAYMDRQIQVDTIRKRFNSSSQPLIEHNSMTDTTYNERILQALVDKDGK